mmetsp:Transcript_115187/g.366045  ORF Transcript_115187/g.366045 Transcript_115187/m.366045 type:complete len:210 (-) Transcript_115187:889-1518(-)
MSGVGPGAAGPRPPPPCRTPRWDRPTAEALKVGCSAARQRRRASLAKPASSPGARAETGTWTAKKSSSETTSRPRQGLRRLCRASSAEPPPAFTAGCSRALTRFRSAGTAKRPTPSWSKSRKRARMASARRPTRGPCKVATKACPSGSSPPAAAVAASMTPFKVAGEVPGPPPRPSIRSAAWKAGTSTGLSVVCLRFRACSSAKDHWSP